MIAALHSIVSRARPVEVAAPALADFQLGAGEAIDARLANQPGWSLYCLDLDARQAVFVELAPDVDLADAAFCGVRQFREARRALVAPLTALPGLAQDVALPETLIFIFSMGRCGTTLAHWMFNEVEGVWGLSEPGALEDLVQGRRRLAPDELRALLQAATRLCFRPPPSRRARAFVVKLRSQALFGAGEFAAAFPQARAIFMHRDAVGWANSRHLTGQRLGGNFIATIESRKEFWRRMTAGASLDGLKPYCDVESEAAGAEEFNAALWARHMAEYESLRAGGMEFLAVDYETLVEDREATARAMLRHSGLPEGAAARALRAFEADSQQGTALARAHAATPMDARQLARFAAALARGGSYTR